MKKGTRVKFLAKVKGTLQVEEIHGIVIKGSTSPNRKIKVHADNDLVYTNYAYAFEVSTKPLPDGLKPTTFKKGQEVTTEWKGKTHRGIVERGGSNRITVLLSDGATELRGHVSLFKLADPRPEFKDAPSAMDGYSVRKYKKVEGLSEETECFTAEIVTPNGEIIHASNRGHGGPNGYFCKKGRGPVKKLVEDAASWATTNDSPYSNTSESEDLWLTWYQYKRPHHISAKDDFAKDRKELSEMGL